jgi:excisionase family DNA binding protein
MVHDDVPVERQTYGVRETARILGIGRNATYEAIQTHKIRALTFGKRLVVPKREVERILAGEEREAA